MSGKKSSLSRFRQSRDPFRLIGKEAESKGGTTPPPSWDIQRDSTLDNSDASQSDSRDNASKRSKAGEVGFVVNSVGYVILSKHIESESRPVDVTGSSGVFVYHPIQEVVPEEDTQRGKAPNLSEAEWRQLSKRELADLPNRIRAEIDKRGWIKATAVFGHLSHRVIVVSEGWSKGYQLGADALGAMIRSTDGEGFTRAVYYYLAMFSREQSDPEALAELKGIQPSTVQTELRKGENKWADQLPTLLQSLD